MRLDAGKRDRTLFITLMVAIKNGYRCKNVRDLFAPEHAPADAPPTTPVLNGDASWENSTK